MAQELAELTTAQIAARTKMLKNNERAIRSEISSLDQNIKEADRNVAENLEKIALNKQLPYLVANVVEVRPEWPLA